MTGAWAAASRSTRSVRSTIPGRAAGGWNFDSGNSKPGLSAARRSLPEISEDSSMTSGFTFPNVPPGQNRINETQLMMWPQPSPGHGLRAEVAVTGGRPGRPRRGPAAKPGPRAATDRSMSAILSPKPSPAGRRQGGSMTLSAALGAVAAAAVAALVIMVGLAGGWRGEPGPAGSG